MNNRSGINWTKLVIALVFLYSMFGFSAMAQTKPDNPLDEEGLAALVEKLKVSLAEVIEEEETQTSITTTSAS